MEIQLWSIGKTHEQYIKEGTEDFTKRISNYYPAKWIIIPPVKNASTFHAEALKKKEAEATLALLQKEDCLIALDERGKSFTSPDLARFIQSRANESARKLVFLIGGAYGLEDSVLKRANYTWSLSALTFPHQLVRLILAEQIYRACTINRNEKYHHG
jgi:23S rRNA (pseudouridine1915-N3)-methyltransferase